MSGYHYKLQIVPNQPIQINSGVDNYWPDIQPNPEMLENFRKLLPINKSWGETEEYRSEENLSVLYIWWENNKVDSIQFEYAPEKQREDTLLNDIISLCIQYDYYLYSEHTENIVNPSKADLWNDFQQCRVFKIYRDKICQFN